MDPDGVSLLFACWLTLWSRTLASCFTAITCRTPFYHNEANHNVARERAKHTRVGDWEKEKGEGVFVSKSRGMLKKKSMDQFDREPIG